jgi:FKBP-type peptidyl-prolyl cis-trans isomerase
MRKQQLVLIFLVGVMTFSAVASGLLLLTANDEELNLPNEEVLGDTANAENDLEIEPEVCNTSEDALTNPGNPAAEWPISLDDKLESLEVEDFREGTGREAAVGDCISVHYRLALANGEEIEGNNTFDELGSPISFDLIPGGLIDGWIEGIPGMKEGGFRRLLVPADLAYGDTERPGIPAGSDLIFDVELVKIEN